MIGPAWQMPMHPDLIRKTGGLPDFRHCLQRRLSCRQAAFIDFAAQHFSVLRSTHNISVYSTSCSLNFAALLLAKSSLADLLRRSAITHQD